MQTSERRKRTRWTLALVLLVGMASGAGAAAVSCQAGPLCSQHMEPVVEHAEEPEPIESRRRITEPVTGVSVELLRVWVESRGVNGTGYFDPDESSDGTIDGAEVGIEIAIEPGPSDDLEGWSERRGEEFLGYVFLQRGWSSLDGLVVWRHDYVADVTGRRLAVVEFTLARGDDVLRVSTFRPAGDRAAVGTLQETVRTVGWPTAGA